GLIAIWPPPSGMTGRVRATYSARVGREVREAREPVGAGV
ncbi:MAG: hypothetical protein QOE28_644, partial [Solirubrobacteraceae bacterium]|nr:hypothetical protein [Solirubrobacteraceae bacterium]